MISLLTAAKYRCDYAEDLAQLIQNIKKCSGEIIAIVPEDDGWCILMKV